jgi:hypothetical protein
MKTKQSLWLYILGRSAHSIEATEILKNMLRYLPKKEYELHVVDTSSCPWILEEKKLLFLPALIRSSPLPETRFIISSGNLEEIAEFLGVLDKISESERSRYKTLAKKNLPSIGQEQKTQTILTVDQKVRNSKSMNLRDAILLKKRSSRTPKSF